MEFDNTAAMNQIKNLWFVKNERDERVRQNIYKDVEMELYESNIPPLLRFHVNEIAPSG